MFNTGLANREKKNLKKIIRPSKSVKPDVWCSGFPLNLPDVTV